MATTSSIEWTDKTWNPVVGCRRVSPGCENCYAETMAGRLARMGQDRYKLVVKQDAAGQPRGRWNGRFEEVPSALSLPLRTKKPARVFVNSMSDLFGEGVSDEYIAACFGVMAACPQHTFQVLTKRAERMAAWFEWAAKDDEVGDGINTAITEMLGVPELNTYLTRNDGDGVFDTGEWDHLIESPPEWPLSNVQIGVSVEDRKHGLPRLDELRKVPAAVRMVSFEPLLEDLGEINLDGIGWAIVGGESGPGARPFDLAWAVSLSEQCRAAGVPYFFKQAGSAPLMMGGRQAGQGRVFDPPVRVRQWSEGLARRMVLSLADRKGGDVGELTRIFPDLAAAGVFRREWPEVPHA